MLAFKYREELLGELLLRDWSRMGQKKPIVLLVDDDDVFRKYLRALFERDGGFDACLEARNSDEALAKIGRPSLNVAVVNSSLPDMSGLQLARELKAIAPELPIFMLTADYNASFEKEALSCGITAVFSKLDDLPTLVANAQAVCGIK
jgi:two-component system response regulator PilR (NtrC family)